MLFGSRLSPAEAALKRETHNYGMLKTHNKMLRALKRHERGWFLQCLHEDVGIQERLQLCLSSTS